MCVNECKVLGPGSNRPSMNSADPKRMATTYAPCLFCGMPTTTRYGLSTLALLAPVNLLGGLLALVLPRNADFYLDNIVLARRPAGSP